MPISFHFLDCKAILITSLTHVSSAIASTRPLPFLPFFPFRLGEENYFIDWLIDCSIDRSIDRSIDPCIHSFIHSLISLLCTVAQKTLGSRCAVDEECRDVNSLCVSKSCRCLDNFYDNNGVCCTSCIIAFIARQSGASVPRQMGAYHLGWNTSPTQIGSLPYANRISACMPIS